MTGFIELLEDVPCHANEFEGYKTAVAGDRAFVGTRGRSELEVWTIYAELNVYLISKDEKGF